MGLKSEIKSTLNLAWPLMGAYVLLLSMAFVDTVMVGRLGKEPLAAIGMAASLSSFVVIVSMGFLSSLSPLFSQAFGEKAYTKMGGTLRNGMWVALGLAAFHLIVYFYSDKILLFLGQDPKLVGLAKSYLLALAWGAPAKTCYLCLRQFTEASSDTKPSIIISALAAISNVFADYVLIFGKYGFPELGLAGAGYATAFLEWFSFLCLLIYVGFRPRYQAFGIWKRLHPGVSLREMIGLGVPASGIMLSETTFFSTVTFLMGTLDVKALAAHQISLNAASLSFMAPLGLSIAIGIRIGQAQGRKDAEGIQTAFKAGVILILTMEVFFAFLFLVFARPIVFLYTSTSEIIPLAIQLIQIAGIFQVVDGLQVLATSSLRALKDVNIPFIGTVIAYWVVGIPVGLTLTYPLGLGPAGLWWGIVAGLAIAATFQFFRFYWLLRYEILDLKHPLSNTGTSEAACLPRSTP